jgi:hypothetical protein
MLSGVGLGFSSSEHEKTNNSNNTDKIIDLIMVGFSDI